MVRLADLLISILIMAGARADRALDCAGLCGSKMTLECCECIGCHQGMRFGKRSAGFFDEDRFGEDNRDVQVARRVLPKISAILGDMLVERSPVERRVFWIRRRTY